MSAVMLHGDQRRRLIASARMLESDQAGERQAAIEAIWRLLPDGTTIADLIDRALGSAPVPADAIPMSVLRHWQRTARAALSAPHLLEQREMVFLGDMQRRRSEPTPKQAEWLSALAARSQSGGRP